MKLVLKRSHLVAILIVGSVVGYPLVSLFSTVTGVENQIASIVMRGSMVVCALIVLIGSLRIPSRLAVALFTVFWVGYILRLAYSFGLTNETFSEPASTFFLWGLGVCLIPSLAVLLYTGSLNFAKTRLAFVLLGAVAMVGILSLGGTAIETVGGRTIDQNRWNLATINSITIGHLGASLILTASAALLYEKAKARRLVFYGAIALIGMAGLFLANSRGPLLAMAIAMGMYGLAQIRSRRTWRYTIVMILGGAVFLLRNTEAVFGSRGIGSRFARLATGEDRSASARTDMYSDGFAQFLGSPLVGDGLEVRTQGFYPHNVILEAFMTTGIIGGMAFLVLTLVSIRAAFRIMKYDPSKAFLALLAMQYIVAAQLSGSIYQSGPMWVLMAGVLVFSAPLNAVRPTKAKRRKATGRVYRELASPPVSVHRGS